MALSLLVKGTLFTTSELESRFNKNGCKIKLHINLKPAHSHAMLACLE
jgi:hypothetical protein